MQIKRFQLFREASVCVLPQEEFTGSLFFANFIDLLSTDFVLCSDHEILPGCERSRGADRSQDGDVPNFHLITCSPEKLLAHFLLETQIC